MPRPLVLSLDIGTSSVRASLYDARLRALRTARVKYDWRQHADGRVERDAGSLESLVGRAVDEVLAGERRPIAAVGCAAFWHSFVGLDARGHAITPVLPWSDLRADTEATRLREDLNERTFHRRTGCRFHPSYWPARLRWFRNHDRRRFDAVRRWVSFPELLERRWLGRDGVSVSQASGTGLMLQDSCEWDADLLRHCRIDRGTLSPIVDLDDGAELSARLKRRWPALAGARWVPAVGDGALNNAGAGCVSRGRAAVMIGTSGAFRVLWKLRPDEKVRTPLGLWRYRLDAARVVSGGALSNGGNVRDWLLRTLGATDEEIERRALELDPDVHGLTVLPFLAGTRSPDYLVHATALIRGLTIATQPEHILRAGLEAVAYRFAAIFDEMKTFLPIRDIVAAGGALERSPGWTQIIADVLGRPILLGGPAELTSRGAAALALEQLGGPPIEKIAMPRGRMIRPHPRRHAVYRRARDRQTALFERVRNLKEGGVKD